MNSMRASLSLEADVNPSHSMQPENQRCDDWIEQFQRLQANQQPPIANINTQLSSIFVGEMKLPYSINHREYENSYVCSIYNAMIEYAGGEIHLIQSRWQRTLLKMLLPVAGLFLKRMKINQTIGLNNWLLSTIPVNNRLDIRALETAKNHLLVTRPNHSLSIRCLNAYETPDLLQHLKDANWLLIPTRQVYLFPKESNWWKRNNVKNDQRLLRKTAFKLKSTAFVREDFGRIAELYRQLYIDKHSIHNPQFSAEYLWQLHHLKIVQFYAFEDEHAKMVAVLGIFELYDIITTPILGYDTDLPQSYGLYRILIAQLMKITHEKHQTLNLSSGAAHFKKQRGGEGFIEYSAYYVEHLSWWRRSAHKVLAKLLQTFAPAIFHSNQI